MGFDFRLGILQPSSKAKSLFPPPDLPPRPLIGYRRGIIFWKNRFKMLRGMRKAGESLVGKIVATVLFCILIGSFAIWGIGDIFRTKPPTVVASVGSTDISTEQFRIAYTGELQRLGRQFRTVVTPEQARLFGVDQRVLNDLISQAILDQQSKKLGLSVSDQLVVRDIMDEPGFKGANGQFDRTMFEQVLNSNGLTEGNFVEQQRTSMTRAQLADALTGDLTIPSAARDAMHRYSSERRSASYIVLQPAAAGDIPDPSPEQVQAFYDEHKSSFQAPEYRALSLIALDAGAIAKPEAVSDADARQRYEQEKAKFGSPERRTIQQISFASQEEAEAAFNRIKEGATFDAIAAERNVSAQDLNLGTFAKAEMLDPVVADAAFALEANAVSGPIAGQFGSVLVRVTQIQPESVKPFEAVAADVRGEIARERAQSDIETVHDAIEDMRASARPLADIAKDKNLTLTQVPAVNRAGQDKAGKLVEIPGREAVLNAAFASDVGVDNEAVRTPDGGYVWYDVTGIEPSRQKNLDEVRDDVARQWHAEETAQRLSEKGRQMTERLDKGETIEGLAHEAGTSVQAATDLVRGISKDVLTADAVTRLFAVPVGKAGNVANGEDARIVFKVTGASVPPLLTTTDEAQKIQDQLRTGMRDDLIQEYIAQIRQDLGVTVNEQAVRQIAGGGEF